MKKKTYKGSEDFKKVINQVKMEGESAIRCLRTMKFNGFYGS